LARIPERKRPFWKTWAYIGHCNVKISFEWCDRILTGLMSPNKNWSEIQPITFKEDKQEVEEIYWSAWLFSGGILKQ
jgi:hypothetical protein